MWCLRILQRTPLNPHRVFSWDFSRFFYINSSWESSKDSLGKYFTDSSVSHFGIAPVIPSRIPLIISSRTTPENPPRIVPRILLGDLPKSQDFSRDTCLVSSPDFYRDITELFPDICGNLLPELLQRFHAKVQSSYAKIFWSEFPGIPLELL